VAGVIRETQNRLILESKLDTKAFDFVFEANKFYIIFDE